MLHDSTDVIIMWIMQKIDSRGTCSVLMLTINRSPGLSESLNIIKNNETGKFTGYILNCKYVHYVNQIILYRRIDTWSISQIK